MQKDSMRSSSSGHMTHDQTVTGESPKTSIQCSHCTLILKSKICFFEHLNKDHGFGVDAALREAGFKKSGANEASTEHNRSGPGNSFQSHCRDLKDHGTQCQMKSEDQNVTGNPMSSENSQSQSHLTSQRKGDAEAKEKSCVLSGTPTSKNKCTLISSKDLKTYNRSLQSVTKYSESDGNPAVALDDDSEPLDGTKETLILEESPSDSSPTSSGVFKVTAKPLIDVSKSDVDRFLLNDNLRIPEPRPPKPKALFRETVPNKVVKRSNDDGIRSPPAKKSKSDEEDRELREKVNGSTQQKSAFSLEFSEDEEEKKINAVSGNTESPDVYFCKHCDYRDGNISRLSTHYQDDHPYIRCKDAYIRDPSDRGATFRCLECPVEFISVLTLKKHYKENHPEAPDVLKIKSRELCLVFRCFVCPFVTHTSAALEKHYKEKHPKHKMDNSLMFCRYSMTRCQEGAAQLNNCEKVPSPARSPEICHKSAHTPSKGVKHAPSPRHPTSKAEGTTIYHCNNCKFRHKSVIVMQVHYQRSHPDEVVTIHTIKQSSCVTPDTVSQMMPDKSPKSVTQKEKSTPPKNAPDLTEKTEKRTERLQQREISSSVTKPQHAPEESAKAGKVESAEDRSKGQKSSPKQSSCVTPDTVSQMMPDKSPKSVTEKEKSTPPKNAPDFTKKTERRTERLQQREISSSVTKPQHAPEESAKAGKVESAEDRSKGQKSPTKCERELSPGTDSPPLDLFYCQLCSFTSPKIKSIVKHHKAKHSEQLSTHIEQVLLHSANVQKKKKKASARTASCDSKTNKQMRHEEDDAVDVSVATPNLYACPEKLFYCEICNYGNTSAQGVINHQIKLHPSIRANFESVVQYTHLVHDEIEKSKSQAKESPFSTYLPLPPIDKSEGNAFFCHFCNYRQSTVCKVLQHYVKQHRAFAANEEQICRYTAMVLSQTEESRLKATASQEVTRTSLGKKGATTETKMLGKVLASPSRPSETKRTLQCDRCAYNCQHVYLLRRHLRNIHRSNRTIANVLKLCYEQGALEAGCHCDLCTFSHKKAAVVFKHYLEQHPGRKLSLNYVATQLYVGPERVSPKKKEPLAKSADGNNDGEDTRESLPPQSVGRHKSKTFSCRACSFKGSSMSSITHHYRAVHPWTVNEVGSILHLINRKKHRAKRPAQEESETPEPFDTYQEPLDYERSPGSSHGAISPKKIKCPICLATFPTPHGLSVHIGIKHQEASPENVDEQRKKQVQIQTRVHVFKCPHCAYVNTNYQGVLTHCQMRHPAHLPRVDSLYVDDVNLRDWENCGNSKVSGLRIRGYMCKTCPQLYATAEKLNAHCRDEHDESGASAAPKKPKSAPTQSAVSEKKQVKTHSKGSLSKSFSLSKKKYAGISCQHCSYSCVTKSALARHHQFRHKNTAAPKVPDRSYKCALCSNLYFMRSRLGMHYTKKHGKEAFLKHYASVYKQVQKKPAPAGPDKALPRQKPTTSVVCDSSTTANENKLLVYKCPRCAYVNARHHGTLTHCQMKHPDVVARADELLTDEILLTDFVRCTLGQGSNLRGYACQICPQVHVTLKKLKIHCDQDHRQAEGTASKRSVETEPEKQPAHGCQDSEPEIVPLKDKTATASTTTTETCQPSTPPLKGRQLLYKCPICAYRGSCRKYLYTHLTNTHKIDKSSTSLLLTKYNKYKRNTSPKQPVEDASEQSACVGCKVCPDLKFDSPQLLIDHYNASHRSNCKLDFIVLSQGTKKISGLYKCALCNKQLKGVRKLCRHLDHHRVTERHLAKAAKAKASLVITAPEDESFKTCGQEEPPSLQTAEERSPGDVTPEALAVSRSPRPSPSKPSDLEQPDMEPTRNKVTCKQCERSFMSLKGLRSHERSHAALAALKKLSNLSTARLKENINKYVLFRDGTTRPFLCSLCSYKTTVMGLWRGHFMKHHQDVLLDTAETDNRDEESAQEADEEPPISTEEFNNSPEFDEEPESTEKSLYLEPPDVQRQLNQYTLMTQAGASNKMDVEETKLPGSSLLHCEVCNFNTGHLSSMRRHYLNRHGKKILRCKDCNFFTGLRKTLEMHMEMGHSTCQSGPTHEKDLRCPFCLYKTKNKNNMIDHIVLHREERVVPMEVRRPKLSRYLRGLVFRCHKCTFTSGSAENLRLHMTKHDDVKPYKCRLCYFDCTHLSDLEAHLSNKHQVLRNHELVGQIRLDQLEARVVRMPEEEEEPLFDNEHPTNGCDDVTIEEFVTDCNDFPQKTRAENQSENDIREDVVWKMKEANPNESAGGENRSEESPTNISASYLHGENTKPNTTVQATLEQDAPEQAEMVFSPNHARGKRSKNIAEKEIGDGNDADIQCKVCNFPERDRQSNESQAQNKARESQVSSVTVTRQNEEAAKGIPAASGILAEEKRDCRLHIKTLKHTTLNIETKIEEDILRHVLQLDEGGGTHKIHKKTACARTVKTENSEPEVKDNDRNEAPSLDEDGNITLAPNQRNQDKKEAISATAMANHRRVNNISGQQHFTVEKHLLTLGPTCRQVKISHKGILSLSSTVCKEKQVQRREDGEEERDPRVEMPALMNECVKGDRRSLSDSKEDDQSDRHQEHEQEEQEDEMITDGEKNRCTNPENRESEGTNGASGALLTVTDGASAEEKPFVCEFCGRNLMNSAELERHIIRHVM